LEPIAQIETESPMAIDLLHVAILLGSCCTPSAGSDTRKIRQKQDWIIASESVSLLQKTAARKKAITSDPSPIPGAKSFRNASLAPEGTRMLEKYKACSLHAQPFAEKAEVYEAEETHTKYVHIAKNAGSVMFNSLVGTMARVVSGYENDMKPFLSKPPANQTWFVATGVRDPLTRSLDAFHTIWKRINCAPPVGHCGTGQMHMTAGHEWQVFQEILKCDPCTQSHPEQVNQWIQSFKETLPQITSKVRAGEGAFGQMLPQLSYLTYDDNSTVDLDYIGKTDGNLETEFQYIFKTEFNLTNNITAGELLAPGAEDLFRLHPSQLPDDVLLTVCTAYYMDYCCFGFEFPDGCKRAGLKCPEN